MKFIIEIKYRLLLILLNWIFILNISYYYKNILVFLLTKYIIYDQKINFYLIYTNISELLSFYLKIMNFLTINTVLYFILYQIILFINFALYKNEYNLIKKTIGYLLILNISLSYIITIYLFPFLWIFFNQFQKTFIFNLIYFEVKINEYLKAFFNTYDLTKYYFLISIFSIFLFKNYINLNIVLKFRKFYFLFIIILISILINDIIVQQILNLLSIFCYELIIFYLIYSIYYKKAIKLKLR